MCSLADFSGDNATLEDNYIEANINYTVNDSFYNEPFNNDIFKSFLDNNILKQKAVNNDVLNNKKIESNFKECF